jgi:ABC-2 type transport system ATP-binding protein
LVQSQYLRIFEGQLVTSAPISTELDSTRSSSTILQTHELVREFGQVRAIDGLEMTVRAGEIYGFLGRNGAGKTTALRMLMGVIKPSGGTIELLGERVRHTPNSLKRRIGYVSQEQNFYPWMTCRSIGNFVRGFYPTWDDDEFVRLAKLFELPMTRKISQLSGGMRVKLALALALAHRPALLLLDEPTSGLDPVARREFLETIEYQARNHGRTTVFSTHRIEEVEEIADQVGILDQGKMRFEGSLETLYQSVRAIRPDVEVPGDFKLLRHHESKGRERRIYLASQDAWGEASFAESDVETLSLEEIFLAFAARVVIDL